MTKWLRRHSRALTVRRQIRTTTIRWQRALLAYACGVTWFDVEIWLKSFTIYEERWGVSAVGVLETIIDFSEYSEEAICSSFFLVSFFFFCIFEESAWDDLLKWQRQLRLTWPLLNIHARVGNRAFYRVEQRKFQFSLPNDKRQCVCDAQNHPRNWCVPPVAGVVCVVCCQGECFSCIGAIFMF